jgi:hypothetical protein
MISSVSQPLAYEALCIFEPGPAGSGIQSVSKLPTCTERPLCQFLLTSSFVALFKRADFSSILLFGTVTNSRFSLRHTFRSSLSFSLTDQAHSSLSPTNFLSITSSLNLAPEFPQNVFLDVASINVMHSSWYGHGS